jgi:hypothetical protein
MVCGFKAPNLEAKPLSRAGDLVRAAGVTELARQINLNLRLTHRRGEETQGTATSCCDRSEPQKHSSKLAGSAVVSTGGMTWARAFYQNRPSTKSLSHEVRQRSSVASAHQLIKRVSCRARRSLSPLRREWPGPPRQPH